MSYDLAVWEGPRPADDHTAAGEYRRRLDADDPGRKPPSAVIAAFVADLLRQYPDLGEPGDESSPWASDSLLQEASGDFIYFVMTYSGARREMARIIATVQRHGLVCFDPQTETVI